MNILHLLSNSKWTERSEPAVDLALAERRLGARIAFVCGHWPEGAQNSVAFNAQKKGLDSVIALEMPKHFRLLSALADVSKLRRVVADFHPDVIHCHMPNAHLVAAMTRGRPRFPLLVRHCYDPSGPKSDLRSRFLYSQCTDGVVVISPAAQESAMRRYGFGSNAVQVAEPGIDLARFSRERKISGSREGFGLKKNDFVVGIVSRIRESRRIDIVLDAVHILAEAFPRLRLLLVGRGRPGAVEKVVKRPLLDMGIADRVILAGYCRNDRLVAAYRAMDVLAYPVPGTDETCRTVREAMASGVPVIATRMGFLPELIEDGVNGRLMDLAPGKLAEIVSDMIRDQDNVTQMARRAYQTAQQRFSTALQGKRTMSFYGRLLRGTAKKPPIS
ncbi:MAG: glycosyltransferase family 4 protein [Thermodesulfobacteriota bacterium]|nr:glycosyltransferase family 4 protein [Thermodesulfobacteriota bacterium]